jgi:GNAT superfamily N-acetyltransferase
MSQRAGHSRIVEEKMAIPMDRITISKATEDDYADLAALQLRSMRTVAAAHYSQAQIDAFLTFATPDLMNVLRVGTVWLARTPRQLVASSAWHFEGELATLGRTPCVDPTVAVFRTIYVRPEWTRRGLASALMTRAEADAASRGATRAYLHAMLSAVEFYLARGYETVSTTIFDLHGVPFPGVSMTRELSEPAAKAA